jgi:alkanesulfonate monooxygenase SsuD/methylene tetrahydromethanopterin reductase-like flavin-dependent oxidoreductase (luciferase family)
MPEFDSGWLYDHFIPLHGTPGGCYEGWTSAAALAARTRRLRLGHLVLGLTHRHPALVAKMASTLDHVSHGRLIVGVGAAHNEEEHRMYGWDLPPAGQRVSMLDAYVRILKGMFSSPEGFDIEAEGYCLKGARCEPAPVSPGGPPIWLGVGGKRGLRVAALLSDGWNHFGSLPEFSERRDLLARYCEEAGRDISELAVSVQLVLREGRWDRLLEEARAYPAGTVQHVIFKIPAYLGPGGIEALAKLVVRPLLDKPRKA